MNLPFTRDIVAKLLVTAAIISLFVLNVLNSYSLGQHLTMYDNPIYRWRESMAIALSRMQDPPLRGYLAYRSISDYLNQHGLAISEDEFKPIPTQEQRHELVYNHAKIEGLLRAAAQTPIDDSLPPVTLNGNEKGLADFYYLAFSLFGLHIESLVIFYFLLLGVSVLIFYLTFRKSPHCMLLLSLYLAGHYFMVTFASHPHFSTIHNSRFFPVLSLLPTLYFITLIFRRTPMTPPVLLGATLQMFIIYFVVFARVQTAWQVLVILASPVLLFSFKKIVVSLKNLRLLPTIIKDDLKDAWPAALAAIGLVCFLIYYSVAFDRVWYRSETRTHLFWHPLYAGMVSASPKMSKLYMGDLRDKYSDNFVYQIVLNDLRKRNEIPPEIGYIVNGQIMINPNWNSGVYDNLVRRIFFETVRSYPFSAIKAFTYDKLWDQIIVLYNGRIFRWRPYLPLVMLAIGVSLISLFAGATLPDRARIRSFLAPVALVAAFSLLTSLIVPSILIVDTILYFLMLAMMILIYFPLAIWMSRRTLKT